MNPFADGAISCTNVTRPLRVFYGEKCQLWRAGNAWQCSWDALLQARAASAVVANVLSFRSPRTIRPLVGMRR